MTWTITAIGVPHTITVHCERKWAPLGVDRFYNLAKLHYFDNSTEAGNNAGFFRVVPNFVVQFGIAGAPPVSAAWQNLNLKDDPVILSNVRGTISYADAGPNTRTTQVGRAKQQAKQNKKKEKRKSKKGNKKNDSEKKTRRKAG